MQHTHLLFWVHTIGLLKLLSRQDTINNTITVFVRTQEVDIDNLVGAKRIVGIQRESCKEVNNAWKLRCVEFTVQIWKNLHVDG